MKCGFVISGLGQVDTEDFGQSDDVSGTAAAAMIRGRTSSKPKQTPLVQMRSVGLVINCLCMYGTALLSSSFLSCINIAYQAVFFFERTK